MSFPPLCFPAYPLKLREIDQKLYVFDEIRKKNIVLTPEEWVRQHLLHFFLHQLHYPRTLISVETLVRLNGMPKRCDVAVWNKHQQALLLAECKAPHIALNPSVFEQTARYNLQLKVRYCLVTNGLQVYCYRLDYEQHTYQFVEQLPNYEELCQ
jgi:hypothetical protein